MDATLELTLLGRTALGALFGLVIGMEREYRGKSAGERTFALLAFAAAGLAGMGSLLLGPEATSRVIQGLLAGVGFIGAGLIFQRKPSDIVGLTTAAGSWAATAIGTVVGLGGYLSGAMLTALMLFILELDSIPFIRQIHERPQEAGPSSASSD